MSGLWLFFLTNLIYLISFVTIVLALGLVILRFRSKSYPSIVIYPSERYYLDPLSGEKHPVPQLGTILLSKRDSITYADLQPSSLYLSVIVPAYNEQERLPSMLEEAFEYLESRRFSYEIIVVDDGSRDKTTQVALSFVRKYGVNKIRVIGLEKNRGKGGAIRIGILAARGELCLFADADGATKFEDYSKLENYINEFQSKYSKQELENRSEIEKEFKPHLFPIAIGSRAHLEQDSIAKRSLFRTILMYGFHFGVWLLTVRTVRDTQCGFKLMPRTIAHILFTHLHVERWAFDVELLVLAEHLRLPIGEIPVRWTEVDGSKLVPFFSWLQMGIDVGLIFIHYITGLHRFPAPPFKQIHSLIEKTK